MDTEIKEVQQEIKRVQQQINDVEGQLTRAITEADISYWQKEKEQLRKEKVLLQEQKLLLFRAKAKEGEPSPKKRKGSPAVPILDSETEISEECRYVKELLAPPDKLPIEVGDLHKFLSDIPRPLPVSSARFVSLRDSILVKISTPAELFVSEYVGITCTTFEEHPDNEATSSCKLEFVTRRFLSYLNSLASPEQQLLSLKTTMDSNRNPGSIGTATALVHLKRPDFALYIRNALILRWEIKIDPADLGTALEENTKKLKVWSHLYYGTLPYMIGGCCGGNIFQWLRLSKNGTLIVADPISKQYDLWTVKGVVEVLYSVVQMHRLLQKLQKHLSVAIPITLYKKILRMNGTVVVGPEFVVKTLKNLKRHEVDFPEFLYESIAGSEYLIQIKGRIIRMRDSTKLELYLVGNPSAKPKDLKELRDATHDMLHGLVKLHDAGLTRIYDGITVSEILLRV